MTVNIRLFFIALWVGLTAVFLSACEPIGPESLVALPETPTIPPTAVPSETPDLTTEFIGLMSPNQGIALQHPADWAVQESPTLVLASNESLLNSSSGVATGALITLLPAPPDVANGPDLAIALNELVGSQEGVRIFSESGNIMINGQEAAQLTAVSLDDLGIEFSAYYMAIRNAQRTVIFAAATPDYETYEPILQAIMSTVIIDEVVATPTPLPPTLTPVPTATPTTEGTAEAAGSDATESETGTDATTTTEGENGDQPLELGAVIPSSFVQFDFDEAIYTLGYPIDWLVDDRDPTAVLFASRAELLADNPFAEGGATVFVYTGEAGIPSEPSPVVILEQFISSYAIYEGYNINIAPYPLVISGKNGASARYEVTFQRAAIIADYYTIVDGSRFVIFVALLDVDSVAEMRPIVEAMVASTVIK